MLAIMLEKLQLVTFLSPNQRISQGWEGKEPASAGFLLAVVLVCYPQDKINKSYKLDTTMKINEIASRRLDEAPPGITPAVKYVGPYFDKAAAAAAKLFGVGKGTTQAELDALRASDTGAAKAAGGSGRPPSGDRPLSTVSKDELNALLYPPRAPKPTVGSFLKRRGDTGFDPDLNKTQALPGFLQNLPPARIGPVIRPSPSGPRPRNATPELGNTEPPLQASPAAAEIGQVRPGVDATASAAGSTAADVRRYTMDEIRHFQELLSTNPAAAQEQAKKMGFLGKAGLATLKGTLATLAAGAGIQGAHLAFPDTVPSVGQMTSKAAGAVSDTITPIGVDPDGSGPPKGQPAWDPTSNEPSSNREEKQSSDKKSSDVDPLRKEKDEELRKALAGEIEESASEFNRIVYLARL